MTIKNSILDFSLLKTLLQEEKLIANIMDPVQTAWMHRLVWIYAGRKRTMIFCHGAAHI
jgi:hypothetical protein